MLHILKQSLLFILLILSLAPAYAAEPTAKDLDVRTDAKTGVSRNAYIDEFKGSFGSFFFGGNITGEKGAKNLIITIARDAKNVFMLVAIVYLVIGVLKILFSKGWDDDAKKWRGSIGWTTIGIVIMQVAYVFMITLYNKTVTGASAFDFLESVVYPFIRLMEVLASFAFLAMAFFAFYRIITSGGDEEGMKKGKQTIVMALAGFILLKIPGVLVSSIYGKAECTERIFGMCKITVSNPNISDTTRIMTTVVNYANSFIALITVLLIIYAGFLLLSSGGDDDKLKKAKSILVYIFIGIFLLVTSYIIFNFFLLKD